MDAEAFNFLHMLAKLSKPATRKQAPLGSNQEVNALRQRLRRRGWIAFSDGGKGLHPIGWIITDAGRAALSHHDQEQSDGR